MPLPSVRTHGAKQCQVKSKRTGLPCNNPAAYGTIACRMHGAHRTRTGLSGESHPNYKHGNCTITVKTEYSNALARLRELKKDLHELGLIKTKTKPIVGRKPKPQR